MIPAGNRKNKMILLVFYFCLLAISCIRPVYPAEMFLQHSVSVIVAIFLVIVALKNSLSDRSFAVLVLFMILHFIGARWIYSYVPYEKWLKWIVDLSGSERNHYDRFVHLMFGIMMMVPLKEIYIKWFRTSESFAGFVAFLTILGFSMFYEVFEWGLTLVLSPEDAENYNGQQGDMWDAQKDMAMAMTGAVINLLFSAISRRKFKVSYNIQNKTEINKQQIDHEE